MNYERKVCKKVLVKTEYKVVDFITFLTIVYNVYLNLQMYELYRFDVIMFVIYIKE